MDPITGSLIVAGAGLASQGFNAHATSSINKRTLQYNREMYDKQKRDNLAYWHMQNEYNSPTSQMSRMREAGLNPMLMYGSGAGNNSAANIDAPSAQAWNPDTPKFDLSATAGSAINTYFDVNMKKQQYDNLKAQNTIMLEEAKLKSAQTLGVLANTASTELNYGLDKQYSGQMRAATLHKINNEIDNLLVQNNTMRLNEKFQYQTFDARKRNILLDNLSQEQKIAFMKMDYDMRKEGIQPNDPLYMRVLYRQFGDKIKSLFK